MVAHLLLKLQLSQCSTISHLLNLSTQSKDMQSKRLNSQRVLGRACWSRKCLRKLKESQRTSSPRKRGLRGINTPLLKTSRCNCQCRPVRPVCSNYKPLYPDRSGPEKPKPKSRCSTWSTKSTLDHSSSTKLVLRGFLSGFSLRVTYEHF